MTQYFGLAICTAVTAGLDCADSEGDRVWYR